MKNSDNDLLTLALHDDDDDHQPAAITFITGK